MKIRAYLATRGCTAAQPELLSPNPASTMITGSPAARGGPAAFRNSLRPPIKTCPEASAVFQSIDSEEAIIAAPESTRGRMIEVGSLGRNATLMGKQSILMHLTV